MSKEPAMFEFDNSPGYEIDGVKGSGFATVVRAKDSADGTHRNIDVAHSQAPRQSILYRIGRFLANHVAFVISGLIVAALTALFGLT